MGRQDLCRPPCQPGLRCHAAFQGLGRLCPVPHWGYCFSGKLVLRYKDGTEEVIRAGDVFYMRPGHTFFTDKNEGCELIEFSDSADFQAMEKALAASKGSTSEEVKCDYRLLITDY